MQEIEYRKLVDALPECPGIMGRDRWFYTAVLVPLVWVDGTYHLLFEKRAAGVRQPGEICFPGGHYAAHDDRDCRETAIRETVEELGIDADKICIDGRLGTLVAAMGTVLESFVGRLALSDITALSLDPKEVDRVFTVPVSYFLETAPETYHVRVEVQPAYLNAEGEKVVLFPTKDLGLPEAYHHAWGGRKYPVRLYRVNGEIIWGLTAEIIYELVRRWRAAAER
ncbi:MAG: coenzyme A pyrophosphatase [Deltaproteobacteria bacterium]|nr:MAG: coenzyme A pyrophosphatase [Deltaproteobacteria bacterium]